MQPVLRHISIDGQRLRSLLGAALLALLAYLLAKRLVPRVIDQPQLAFVIPAGLLAAVICSRRPALAVGGLLVVVGFSGSIPAFTGINPLTVADVVLAGLWAGTIWGYLTGARKHAAWLWPGVIACALYLSLTGFEVLTAPDRHVGFISFRLSAWHMLAMLLIAYAPWSRLTFLRIADAAVLVTLAVAVYACFRKVVGSAADEHAYALQSAASLGVGEELRFFGSFPSAQELAAFCAAGGTFALSLALNSRRRIRTPAALTAVLCLIAVFATDIRAGLIAMAVGSIAVLLLTQFSAAREGVRLGTNLVAIAALVVAGTAGFLFAADNSGTNESRYANIFNPSNDLAYQTRLQRWKSVIAEADEHPLGEGLGTAGSAARQYGRFRTIGAGNIDSSYLKIALEQGLTVMAFFAAAVVLLFLGLARRAVFARDPDVAALAIGGSGVLIGLLILFYFGLYIEGLAALGAWVMVGLGVAQFSKLPAVSRPDSSPADLEAPEPAPASAV